MDTNEAIPLLTEHGVVSCGGSGRGRRLAAGAGGYVHDTKAFPRKRLHTFSPTKPAAKRVNETTRGRTDLHDRTGRSTTNFPEAVPSCHDEKTGHLPILSNPILSYLILSYPILSFPAGNMAHTDKQTKHSATSTQKDQTQAELLHAYIQTCVHQPLKQRPVSVPREHPDPLAPDEVHHPEGILHVLRHQYVRVADLLPLPPGPSRPRHRRRGRTAEVRFVVGVAKPSVAAVAPCRGRCEVRPSARAKPSAGKRRRDVVVVVMAAVARGRIAEAFVLELAVGKREP